MTNYKMSPWVFPGMLKPRSRTVKEMMTNFEKVAEQRYGVLFSDIQSDSRTPHLVYLRHLFCYYFRTHYSAIAQWSIIGKALFKDHTTAIDGFQRYKKRLDTDELLPVKLGISARTKEDYFTFCKLMELCL